VTAHNVFASTGLKPLDKFRNDVAILWPPNRPPVIVTAYLTESKVSAAARDAAIAGVGRVVSIALE